MENSKDKMAPQFPVASGHKPQVRERVSTFLRQ